MQLRRIVRAAIAYAMLGTACALFAADAIRVVERQVLRVGGAPNDATHALKLEVYTFSTTRWRRGAIVEALPRAAELLAQCGVALERADLVVVDAPPPYRDYYTPLSRELVRALDVRKPALFFDDDTRNDPAFEAEAIGFGNARTRPELANTVWIAYGAHDLPHAIAHELVHVLADSGAHSSEPGNLMRDETSPTATRLTAAPCERVKSRGTANKLLARRE